MLEAERIAKDPSVMGYSDMDELFADLRHYRIIQRVRIGAKICAAKRRKTAGILCVLQGFATHLWGKSAAKTCVENCAVMPERNEPDEICRKVHHAISEGLQAGHQAWLEN